MTGIGDRNHWGSRPVDRPLPCLRVGAKWAWVGVVVKVSNFIDRMLEKRRG
jgi:hypothetical protein